MLYPYDNTSDKRVLEIRTNVSSMDMAPLLPNLRREVKQMYPQIALLELVFSTTPGNGALDPGNPTTPSETRGAYAWGRVKFIDGHYGPWISKGRMPVEMGIRLNGNGFLYGIRDTELFRSIIFGEYHDIIRQATELGQKWEPFRRPDSVISSAEIPNTEYITLNDQGIFVCGESTCYYRGKPIKKIIERPLTQKEPIDISQCFKTILFRYPVIKEMHIMSSETKGEYGNYGTPSMQCGEHVWCRIKMKNGIIGKWVYRAGNEYKDKTESWAAFNCVDRFYSEIDFCAKVFGGVIEQQR